ncbi:MAG: ABC transporter permease [Candidatus Eisenbacteria sp.]|nr:ABC transporter permease [Candidatus Eisenbacteria bacterium]
MRTLDLLRFSAGGLRGHRLRTILSLIGVAIGVGSVIMLTSLGEGARLYVTGEFTSLGSNLLIVMPGKTETHGGAPFVSSAPHDLTLDDVDAIRRRVPAIGQVAPVSLGSGPVAYGERSRECVVIGTEHEMLGIRHLAMGIGRYLPPGERDAPVAVLGAKLQRELFGHQNPLGRMIRIGDWRFRVIGVLAARGTSIGLNLDEVVMIPVETAMRLFNQTSLFRIQVEVRAHQESDAACEAIMRVLMERHDGDEDVTVLTQDAVLATFTQILNALTAALVGIAAISLTVAGIGIMNVMLVSISERTREIGLLKAVGVTRRQITGVFLIEAVMISTTGGVLGLFVGIVSGRIFQRIVPDFPIHAPLWAVGAALGVSMTVGILFGSLPARQAARLDPVEALMRKRA